MLEGQLWMLLSPWRVNKENIKKETRSLWGFYLRKVYDRVHREVL